MTPEPTDRGLLEAALFLSPQPLSRRRLAGLLSDASVHYVDRLLDELQEDLEGVQWGIELRRDGEHVALQVKRPYVDAVAHLAPHQDIPRPVLRTLAVVAYNNPVTQANLVKARGNKSYAHVQDLLERGLIRAEPEGRTLLLQVTDEFLRYFGLSNAEEFRFHAGAAEERTSEEAEGTMADPSDAKTEESAIPTEDPPESGGQ